MTREDVAAFVASLAIPEDRRQIVLAELLDHFDNAIRDGVEPGLGDLAELRARLENVEPAFRVSRGRAILHGLVAAIGVVVAFGLAGDSPIGPLAAVAIAALLAPPRALALLRAELRAARVRGAFGVGGGVPVGPVLTYVFVVMCVPMLVAIAVLIAGGYLGVAAHVPLSRLPRFAMTVLAVYALLAVEAVRARRRAIS